MDGKVSCIDCGALILKATADRNDGKCVPCKKGFRASIEDSKRRIEADRKRPPEPNYWLPLVDKESRKGFGSLSPAEKIYFCACLLDGEVHNGGFEQFFTNSSGSYYYESEASLAALDFTECLALLRQAKQALFGQEDVPAEYAPRVQAVLAALQNEDNIRHLDELDNSFVEAFKGAGKRVEEFAVQNNLQFVLK